MPESMETMQRPTMSERDAVRLERYLARREGLSRMLAKKPHH